MTYNLKYTMLEVLFPKVHLKLGSSFFFFSCVSLMWLYFIPEQADIYIYIFSLKKNVSGIFYTVFCFLGFFPT